MQIGFPGPHPPYDPTPDYAEAYMEKDLPLPEVTQEDLDGQPPAFKQLRQHNFAIDHDFIVHLDQPTEAQLQRQRAYYLANVSMIDTQVGQILNTLDERGYLDNSVVIFTSDHGDCLGDHGHSQKWTMYDIITRVPLIVWSPGLVQAGQRRDELCQLMDLGRTVLDLAGVEPPETMQAESLLPALEGDAHWTGRERVFAEHVPDGIYEGPYMTMVRDRQWKLVHFVDEAEGQLFDLSADPDEVHNLWPDPQYKAIRQKLLLDILNWRVRSTQQTADLFSQSR